MTVHRNLAIATGLAAAIGFGAVPAIAQTASDAAQGGEGFRTEIMRSDTWKPGYMKTDDGDYRMIVPESQEEADAMPMRIMRSNEWQPGYMKTDEGDYYMLAPAEEARDESTRIIRSDEWQPGFMKSDDGDYFMIVDDGEG